MLVFIGFNTLASVEQNGHTKNEYRHYQRALLLCTQIYQIYARMSWHANQTE